MLNRVNTTTPWCVKLKQAPRSPRQYRSSRRRFRNGERAAVKRALTAARLYASGAAPTLAAAADSCGSNVQYVRAAVVLLKSEDRYMLDLVLEGKVQLLDAGRALTHLAQLVSAFRASSSIIHARFGAIIGTGDLFDAFISPHV
jgi:hypothetical protein